MAVVKKFEVMSVGLNDVYVIFHILVFLTGAFMRKWMRFDLSLQVVVFWVQMTSSDSLTAFSLVSQYQVSLKSIQ
jgi:hypothetical protein